MAGCDAFSAGLHGWGLNKSLRLYTLWWDKVVLRRGCSIQASRRFHDMRFSKEVK